MRHKRTFKESALVFLIAFMLVSAVLISYSAQAIADDLPLLKEPPSQSKPDVEYVPAEIIVKFRDGILSTAEHQLNRNLGTSVIHASPRGGFKVLKIPVGRTVAEMVDIYSKQPIVEYAEPNYIDRITWSPNDTLYSIQWNFAHINMEDAWDLDTTAPNYGG